MTISDELTRLAILRNEGHLDEDEFLALKAKIISGALSLDDLDPRRKDHASVARLPGPSATPPHPLRIVVSVFLMLIIIAAVVFGALLPFKADRFGEPQSCSAPMFELSSRGERNLNYDPNFRPDPSWSKIVAAYERAAVSSKYHPNYCANSARTKFVVCVSFVVISTIALLFLWRSHLPKPHTKKNAMKLSPSASG